MSREQLVQVAWEIHLALIPPNDLLASGERNAVAIIERLLGQEREKVREMLALIYSKYEDGPDCYEQPDEEIGYIGKAVQLTEAEENQIIAVLDLTKPESDLAGSRGEKENCNG